MISTIKLLTLLLVGLALVQSVTGPLLTLVLATAGIAWVFGADVRGGLWRGVAYLRTLVWQAALVLLLAWLAVGGLLGSTQGIRSRHPLAISLGMALIGFVLWRMWQLLRRLGPRRSVRLVRAPLPPSAKWVAPRSPKRRRTL